jgi:hypothetical protein
MTEGPPAPISSLTIGGQTGFFCSKASSSTMSSFGNFFRVTTFGESHCPGVGCVVDGVPPRMRLTEADIQVLRLCLRAFVELHAICSVCDDKNFALTASFSARYNLTDVVLDKLVLEVSARGEMRKMRSPSCPVWFRYAFSNCTLDLRG